MRLYYQNVIDSDGVLFTPSTYDPAYPADLLANQQRSYGWKTGDTQAAESVVIDLGSAQSVTSCILLDHDLTVGDSGIAIQGNSADAWGGPPVNESLTWAPGIISKNFAGGSYRYWRLIFTKASAGDQRTIGRLFLGPYYSTTEAPSDAQIEPIDLSQMQRADGGQSWSDAQDCYRVFGLDFPQMSNTQADALIAFANVVGTHKSFFVQVDENSGNAKLSERVYARLQKKPSIKSNGFDPTGEIAWDTKFEFEEQL